MAPFVAVHRVGVRLDEDLGIRVGLERFVEHAFEARPIGTPLSDGAIVQGLIDHEHALAAFGALEGDVGRVVVLGEPMAADAVHASTRALLLIRAERPGANNILEVGTLPGIVIDPLVVDDDGVGLIALESGPPRAQKAVLQAHVGKAIAGGPMARPVGGGLVSPTDDDIDALRHQWSQDTALREFGEEGVKGAQSGNARRSQAGHTPCRFAMSHLTPREISRPPPSRRLAIELPSILGAGPEPPALHESLGLLSGRGVSAPP